MESRLWEPRTIRLNRVTVPWGMTPEPQVGDVGPLQLSTDAPTLPSLNPLTPPPVSMPTLPVPAVPNAIPTAAPTTVPKPKAKATATAKAAKPTTPPAAKHRPRRPEADHETDDRRSETDHGRPKPTTAARSRPPPPKPTTKPTTAKPTTAAPKPPVAAVARSNPYSPQQVCGAGFSVQQSASFPGGTAYQLYNPSTGNNCAVTMKTADVGKATQVSATLEVQGGGSSTDRGSYEFYAGPVILPGKGKCVRISGSGPGGSNGTGWANCG